MKDHSHGSVFDVLASKTALARLVPDAVPPTFVLPADADRLAAAWATPGWRWMQRPDAATGGLGDHRIDDPADAEGTERWVVQRDDALAGRRRACVVVVPSLDPLLVYVLGEEVGDPELVRLAAMPVVAARDAARSAARAAPAEPAEPAGRVEPAGGRPPACLTAVIDVEIADPGHGGPRVVELEARPGCSCDRDGALSMLLSSSRPTTDVAVEGAVLAFPSAGLWPELVHPRPGDVALARSLGVAVEPGPVTPRPADVWPVGDELLVAPSHGRGELVLLNAAAAFVWLGLRDGAPLDVLASELAQEAGLGPTRSRADIDDAVADLADAGLVETGRSRRAPGGVVEGPPAPSRRTYRRWNVADVHDIAGARVSVRYPSIEIAAVGRRLLTTTVGAPEEGSELTAAVEVVRAGAGWDVRARSVPQQSVPPQRVPALHQLAAAVRRAVVAAAAWSSPALMLQCAALSSTQGAVLVGGTSQTRRDLILRWIAAGGAVIADVLAPVDQQGIVAPLRLGVLGSPSYQWIDGVPAAPSEPGAPMVAPDGRLVDVWHPPASATSTEPAPVGLVVMASDAETGFADVSVGEACRWLLAMRYSVPATPGGRSAPAIAACAERVPHLRAPLSPQALLAELAARGFTPARGS